MFIKARVNNLIYGKDEKGNTAAIFCDITIIDDVKGTHPFEYSLKGTDVQTVLSAKDQGATIGTLLNPYIKAEYNAWIAEIPPAPDQPITVPPIITLN